MLCVNPRFACSASDGGVTGSSPPESSKAGTSECSGSWKSGSMGPRGQMEQMLRRPSSWPSRDTFFPAPTRFTFVRSQKGTSSLHTTLLCMPIGDGIAVRAIDHQKLRSEGREVGGRGRPMQHQRQKRSLLSRVTSEPQNGRQVIVRKVELRRLAARRIRQSARTPDVTAASSRSE